MSGDIYSHFLTRSTIDLSGIVTSSSDIDVIEIFYGSHSPYEEEIEVETISFLF